VAIRYKTERSLYADDRDSAIEHRRGYGVPIVEEPHTNRGVRGSATVSDPDGNGVIAGARAPT
jgi:hypothetical protein